MYAATLVSALLVGLGQSVGAAECAAPKLSDSKVLEVFHADAAKRGGKLDPKKWRVGVKEDACLYFVFAEIPDERGSHFAVWIDRNGKVVKRFQGR